MPFPERAGLGAAVLLLAVLATPAHAQDRVGPEITQTFAAAEGLVPGPVTALAVDAAGRLWAGSANPPRSGLSGGLRLLAGEEFLVEPEMLTGGRVAIEGIRDIAIGPPCAGAGASGSVTFVATQGGLFRRDCDGSWTSNVGGDAGLDSEVAAVVHGPDGTVWAGGENVGLYELTGDTATAADPAAQVVTLTIDGRGQLWVGTTSGVHVDDSEGRLVPGEDLPPGDIQVLATDADGDVWLGTSAGLVLFDGVEVAAVLTEADGLPASSILSLAPDLGGGVWVGTAAGAAFADRAGIAPGIWLAGTEVTSLVVDPAGDLWAGSVAGVAKRSIGTWREVTEIAGEILDAAVGRDGAVYAATADGVWRSAGDGWQQVNGLEGATVTAIAPGGDSLLVGTTSGWGQVAAGRYQPSDACCQERVTALHQDASGTIWVGTAAGLVPVGAGGAASRLGEAEGLGTLYVTDIWGGTAGAVWVATQNGGATRFPEGGGPGEEVVDVDNTSVPPDGNEPARTGLASNRVNAGLVTSSGELWLATDGGVSRRVGDRWHTFAAGALQGSSTVLLETQGARVWVGTQTDGLVLVRCDGPDEDDCLVSQFRTNDGLPANQVTALAAGENLMVGTAGGLVVHSRDDDPPALSVGHLATDQSIPRNPVQVLTRAAISTQAGVCDPPCTSLEHDVGRAEISLVGFDLADPAGLRYLASVNGEPAVPGAPSVDLGVRSASVVDATLLNLDLDAGRDYVVEISAVDRHLNRSPTETLTFAVAAIPLTQQPWFWPLVTLFLMGIGVWLYAHWGRLRFRAMSVSLAGSPGHPYRVTTRVSRWRARTREQEIDVDQIDHLHDAIRERGDVTAETLAAVGRSLYRTALAATLRRRHLLKLRRAILLRVDLSDARELDVLPWEALHGGDDIGHLAVRGRLSVVRRVEPQIAAGATAGRPLRVVVAAAGTGPDIVEEVEGVTAALAEIDGLDVVVLHPASWAALEEEAERGADVFHFIGHGGSDAAGRPSLEFEDPESQQPHPIAGDDVVAVFERDEERVATPRLVVLNACRSADAGTQRLVGGITRAFVDEGVAAAAVGMGYPIYGEAAVVFARALYRSLAQHGRIEHAVTDARLALRNQLRGTRDWVIPRLYASDIDRATFGGGRRHR